MIRNRYLAYALYVATFVVFWNLLDYLLGTFLIGSGYRFTVARELVEPLVVGALIGYFAYLRGKKKDE